jgi:hypothetical protein
MTKEFKNGPALASLAAAGFASLVLGICVVLVEVSPLIKSMLNFYHPVGPLSGKTILATGAYVLSWGGLHFTFKNNHVDEKKWLGATFAMIVLGLLLTFPY